MANTLAVRSPSEQDPVLISRELFNILKAQSKGLSSQLTFIQHCERTGRPTIPDDHFVVKYSFRFDCHSASIDCDQRRYRGTAHTKNEAIEDVYRQIVSTLIAKEVDKVDHPMAAL